MARGAGHRNRMRAEIVRHDLRLFAEHSPHAVTVDQIAAAAQVSALTVDRHFGTKGAIVLDSRVEAAEQLRAFAGEGPVSRDPRVCVAAALRRWSAVPVDQDLYEMRSRIIQASPALQRLALSSRGEFEQALVAVLQDRGLTAAEWHLRVAVSAGLAAFHEAVRRWRDDRGQGLPEVTEHALALLWPDLLEPPGRDALH